MISPTCVDPLVCTQQLLCADGRITKEGAISDSQIKFLSSEIWGAGFGLGFLGVMRCRIALSVLANFCFFACSSVALFPW